MELLGYNQDGTIGGLWLLDERISDNSYKDGTIGRLWTQCPILVIYYDFWMQGTQRVLKKMEQGTRLVVIKM